MSPRPSFRAMAANDYVSFFAVVFPLVMFGIAFIIRVFGAMPDLKHGRAPIGAEGIPFFLGFGAVTLCIDAVVLVWRYYRAARFFREGLEVSGVITRVWKFRDRGRVYYRYVHGDTEYTQSAPVHFSHAVRALEEGRSVRILMMRAQPLRSLLKDLYISSP